MRILRLVTCGIGLLSAIAGTASAQWGFGVQAGVTYSTVFGGSGNADFQPGFLFGGRVERRVSPVVSFSAEVNYDMMGAKNIRQPGQPSFTKLELTQIDIPVLVNIEVPLEIPMHVIFSVGVTASINLTCSLDETDCPDDAVNSVAFGLPLGGTFGWDAGSGGIFFDLRATFIPLSDYFSGTGEVAPQQMAFQGTVRYMF